MPWQTQRARQSSVEAARAVGLIAPFPWITPDFCRSPRFRAGALEACVDATRLRVRRRALASGEADGTTAPTVALDFLVCAEPVMALLRPRNARGQPVIRATRATLWHDRRSGGKAGSCSSPASTGGALSRTTERRPVAPPSGPAWVRTIHDTADATGGPLSARGSSDCIVNAPAFDLGRVARTSERQFARLSVVPGGRAGSDPYALRRFRFLVAIFCSPGPRRRSLCAA